MFATSIKKFGAAAAVAALTLVGWAGSAQALQVVGRWDPTYGAPFTNLGWAGEAIFEVDSCYFTLGTGSYNYGGCIGGTGSITVVSARVDFYDTSGTDSDLSDDTPKGSLFWNGSLPSVQKINFNGSNVIGVKTGLFDWQFGPSTFQGIDYYEFALKFTGNSVILKNRIWDYCEYDYGVNDFAKYPPKLTFSVVPEPQTYALVLASLAAFGLTAKRRRRR